MKPFDYAELESIGAVNASFSDRRRPLAGGTDLLTLLKARVIEVDSLLDLKQSDLPRGIEDNGGAMTIGALTTLTAIESSSVIASRYPMLAQAAASAATRQIRNRATIGGNLLQRPRCAYFRDPTLHCWLAGGDECFAIDGRNAHHAIFAAGPCHAAHPSDPAGSLLALDAIVTLRGRTAERQLKLDEFFAPPEIVRRTETVIEPDEILSDIRIPARGPNWEGCYLKVMDRKSWAFALVGLALAVRRDAGRVTDARVVFTGVAPIPWRHRACEAALIAGHDIDRVADAATRDAAPLKENAYKLDLCRRLLGRAWHSIGAKI